MLPPKGDYKIIIIIIPTKQIYKAMSYLYIPKNKNMIKLYLDNKLPYGITIN